VPPRTGLTVNCAVGAGKVVEQARGRVLEHHSHTHYGWPLIAARIAALYAGLLAASPRAARA
jgi:hypothetical protein